MKKYLVCILLITLLIGCSNSNSQGDEIKVYTRNSASGTREAFESIINLESLTDESAETNGNGDMAKQIGANQNAIGYVSLSTDFQANNLKKVEYEGVEATIESVLDSSYKLARPFSFVTRAADDFESKEKADLVIAILDYINNSTEGREVILAAGGIVDINSGTDWSELSKKHPIINQDNSHLTIKTGGSTSVEKTLFRVMSSFIPMAGDFNFEPSHTGSGDGYKRVLGSEKDSANSIDIGFASRDFKDNEVLDKALLSGVYTKDAVVVVINEQNQTISNLKANDLVSIFSGEHNLWSQLD